jgi:hypothetical protein
VLHDSACACAYDDTNFHNKELVKQGRVSAA